MVKLQLHIGRLSDVTHVTGDVIQHRTSYHLSESQRTCSDSSWVLATTTPAMTSACPEINLVALCTTRSAPSDSGFWRHGVIIVLSTSTRAFLECATRHISVMLMIRCMGFVGLSIITRRVLSVMTAERLAGPAEPDISTYRTLILLREAT